MKKLHILSLLTTCLYLPLSSPYCYGAAPQQAAIQYYTSALQSYAQNPVKNALLLAQIYNNMGMSYLALKDYAQTSHCYDKALRIRQQALAIAISRHNAHCKSISISVGKSHHNLGHLYLAMHRPKAAMLALQAALQTEWQHHVEALDTQVSLAWAYPVSYTHLTLPTKA